MTSAAGKGGAWSRRKRSASAGGQDEQPSEVNSSTSTGVREPAAAEFATEAASPGELLPATMIRRTITTIAKTNHNFMCTPRDCVPLFDARDSFRDAVEKPDGVAEAKRAGPNYEAIQGKGAAEVALNFLEDVDVLRKGVRVKGGHDA